MSRPSTPAEIRFWRMVNKDGPLPPERPGLGPCWLWIASCDRDGYGRFQIRRDRKVGAHQFAYEWEVGTIPSGLQLDHLCLTRSCVNPLHLEPVTLQENDRRGLLAHRQRLFCNRGHPWAENERADG